MSWIKYAKPGDKVVCIADDWFSEDDGKRHGHTVTRVGMVYTIREVRFCDGDFYLWLAEIVNVPKEGRDEADFHWGGFDPVQSRPTDISIFTKLLTNTPALEEV